MIFRQRNRFHKTLSFDIFNVVISYTNNEKHIKALTECVLVL